MKDNSWLFWLDELEIYRKMDMRRDILSNERKLVQSSAPFWICRANSIFIFPGIWLEGRKLLLMGTPKAGFCHPSISVPAADYNTGPSNRKPS